MNKVIVIATVITYTILSNNVIMFLFFTICHCYCRYTNLHLTLFSYLIHYFVGQNYNCKFATLPFGGGLLRLQSVLYLQLLWWGLPSSYCITTFIRNTKKEFQRFSLSSMLMVPICIVFGIPMVASASIYCYY